MEYTVHEKCFYKISWVSASYFCTSIGNDRLLMHKQLCEAVEATAVGEVLRGVNEFDCEELYRHYLQDFVRLVHRCSHTKKTEYETKEYEVRPSKST